MNTSWALNAADVGPLGFIAVAAIATIGALLIHFLRRARSSAQPDIPPSASSGEPTPEDRELANRLREIAGKMGLPGRVLPRAHAPNGDGDFVWRDGEIYRYRSLERGGAIADHEANNFEDLLYPVFADRSRMHCYIETIGLEEPGREAEIVRRQQAMLAAANPDWVLRTGAGA